MSNEYGDFPQHLEKLFSNAEEIIYRGIKRSFLLKEATTESFYLLKVTSATDAKKAKTKPPKNPPKTQQLPQYYFKTNISNLIFIRMYLFLHTNKSKNQDPDFIYTYKYIQKAMQTIIELHLLDKNAKLVSLHKKQLQFEDISHLPLLPAPSPPHLNLCIS